MRADMTAIPAGNQPDPQASRLVNVYGFSIFPVHGVSKNGQCTCGKPDCDHPGKHPATKNGYKDATTDLARYAELVAGRRNLNCGIATGEPSGIFVVDIDGPEGETALAELCELPATLTVNTGKGRHLYFKWPGHEIKNRTRILPGVDIRGDGGYVIAPGSKHASGTTYEFHNLLEEIVDAPPELLTLITRQKVPASSAPIPAPYQAPQDTRPYIQAAIDGEVSSLAQAQEGTRNDQLNKSAFALSGLLPPDQVRNILRPVALNIGLSAPEIDATLASAAKSATPRRIPEGSSQTYGPKHDFSADAQTNKKTARKFKFIPVSEIINNLQPIQWLINGYIEQHTMTLIFGDPASGKSFIAIDKACCIATGTPYHGHDVSQGAVFYIAGEGHNGLGRRFKAWERHNGLSLENAPLYVAERPAQLFDAEHAKAVTDAVQELADINGKKPCLIVIDTLARNFGGGDENSTKDMNLFIQHIDELKDRWQATALIVHHTGHGDKSRARGAIALKGALDHEYHIQKDAGGIISLQSTKTKDGPDPETLYFEIVTVPVLHNGGTIPLEGAALAKTGGQTQPKAGKKLSLQKRRAVDILQNCLIDKGEKRHVRKGMAPIICVTLNEYREAMRLENIVDSDDPDNIRRSISRTITQLNNERITVSYDNFIWLPDKPDKTGRTKSGNTPEADGQDKTL